MSKDSIAARALLAHFNHQLAGRLLRRLFKTQNPEAWKKLTAEVLALIPTAAEARLWRMILAYVEKEGAQYIDSPAFQNRVKAHIEESAVRLIPQTEEVVIREHVNKYVQRFLNGYDVIQFLKDGPGKFKALYDVELKRMSENKAILSASQEQLIASSNFQAIVAEEVGRQMDRIALAQAKKPRKR